VALTAANVVIIALASGTLDDLGEKEEALSGMPLLLLLLRAVGAAGEFRHRTAAPPRWPQACPGHGCCLGGPAPMRSRAWLSDC